MSTRETKMPLQLQTPNQNMPYAPDGCRDPDTGRFRSRGAFRANLFIYAYEITRKNPRMSTILASVSLSHCLTALCACVCV